MSARRSILGGACGLLLLGAGLTAVSCVEVPTSAECETACSIASRCGLLPSALGGTVGASRRDNELECVTRCEASDGASGEVDSLLAALGARASEDGDGELAAMIAQLDKPPLCGPEGTDACESLIAQLQADPETSKLEVTTTLTVRMISAGSYVTNTSLRSWCCFDFAEEIDDDPANPLGNEPSTNIDELQSLIELFEPTRACLSGVQGQIGVTQARLQELGQLLQLLQESMEDGTIDPPTPEQIGAAEELVRKECGEIAPLWDPSYAMLDPGDMPSGEDHDCRYARMSNLVSSHMSSSLAGLSCDPTDPVTLEHALVDLSITLDQITLEWRLDPGGPLVGDDGSVRDSATIHQLLHAEIRDELARPHGFIEDACDDLLGDAGSDACEGLELPDIKCVGGPACSKADCLDEDARAPACDTSQCYSDSSPPGRECDLLGVTEIRLGYRTSRGLETFGDPITDCPGRTELATVFEDVRVGPLTPVAVITGTLPQFLAPEDGSGRGTYSWVVEGNTRWATAGEAVLEVPSPLLELLQNGLEDPLEGLGWVPQRLPTGKACDDEPKQCEGYFNDNCDNGIDDDGNGLADADEPWCDCLFEALVDHCVAVPPGMPAPRCCTDPSQPGCPESTPNQCHND